MERNLSTGHGGLRLVLACGLLILALDVFAIIGETRWAWTALAAAALGAIMMWTGLSGYCPVVAAVGAGKPTTTQP